MPHDTPFPDSGHSNSGHSVSGLPDPASPAAEADLVALVGSRLCHDLISPLGAIGNGVELLAMSGMQDIPEVQLITESVAAANARIKFFRIAFGQGGEQRLGRSEIVTVLDEIARGGRLSYHWLAPDDSQRRVVKLVFLGLLCLEPALPWGGEVVVSCDNGLWRLSAQTRRTKPDPALWARLSGETGALSPAQVQFALLPREAALQGRRIEWTLEDTAAEIRF